MSSDNRFNVKITGEKNIIANITSGARGKSAYESWLDQGNTGTEADFVNALLQDSTYIHNQQTSSSEWTITHDLKKFPSVTVIDDYDRVVNGEITYLNENSLKINFTRQGGPYAFHGKAYLN